MKKTHLLCAAGAFLATATVALALQLVVKSDPDAIVASRVQGSWKLEVATSDRLDPKRPAGAAKEITFTDNPGVLAGLQAHSDRFKNREIFGSGIVNVDGKTHPYILVGEHGGTSVVWFTGNEAGTDPVAKATTNTLAIAVGRDRSADLLFLGGDTRGTPAVAYSHPAAGAPAGR